MSAINKKPYFIAEIGVNHEGSIQKAMEMVRTAAGAGADAVKFQTYKAEKLASKNSPAYWDKSKEPTTSQFKLFQKYDGFERADYDLLKVLCVDLGVDFISTPFDLDCVDWLVPMMDKVKIASADITNDFLLTKVASYRKPMILSVGAATSKEIWHAVNLIRGKGCDDISLLHCMLLYPTSLCDAHLNRITELKDEFKDEGIEIGYSDHVPPSLANNDQLIIACALGATIIEKHYTFDKMLSGNDHYHSLDASDLSVFNTRLDWLVEMTQIINESDLCDKQKSAIANARRSLVYKSNLISGTVICEDDLIAKRPGTGVSVTAANDFIGKILSVSVLEDQLLSPEDFK